MATTALNVPIGRADLLVAKDVGDEIMAKKRVAMGVKEYREMIDRAQQLESLGAEGTLPGRGGTMLHTD